MPLVQIPITPPYKNVTEIGVQKFGAECLNGYINEFGELIKRPALVNPIYIGEYGSFQGLYYWREKNLVIAVINGNIYTMDVNGVITNITSATLGTKQRVIFDSDGTYLFMANGGQIVYWTGLGLTAYHPSANTPNNVTHVLLMDKYLIMNKANTDLITFSNTGTPLIINAANVFTASYKSDNVVGMVMRNDTLLLFGNKTIEFWQNDGVNPFSALTGTNIDKGTNEPYTIIQRENNIYLLDEERKVSSISGKGITPISPAYNKEIHGLSANTGNAYGMDITWQGRSFYVLVFPDDNKSYVFDYMTNQFHGNWTNYDPVSGIDNKWMATAYSYVPQWNKHLTGGNDGNIYELSDTSFQDNGTMIKTTYRTSMINHGTNNRKRSKRIMFKLNRGQDSSPSQIPVFMIRWRDDNDSWTDPITVSLGDVGDYISFADLWQLGIYRNRQWEIIHTDNSKFGLISMEEDFDFLLN